MNELRIIGGKYRSRKITFVDADGLRPTPNRIRETLFNWLAPYIYGANVLDLFAGAGSLAFEACSRGAKSVIACELNYQAYVKLLENQQNLACDNLELKNINAFDFVKQANQQPFDIILLDPPFNHNFIPLILEELLKNNFTNKDTLIYLESERLENIKHLTTLKEKKAGQVFYSLNNGLI
jgi:16S rRNA (guanine966-N2)-methyltransferase